MKKKLLLPALFLLISGMFMNLMSQTSVPDTWTKKKAAKWFKQKEYLKGANITPHSAIDQIEFAKQYHTNQAYWDAAFAFIKGHDLATLAKGRHTIDGTNVYAIVTEDPSKNYEQTKWESHRKYIDLQYVITGEENMGKMPVQDATTVTNVYDEAKDIAFYNGEGKIHTVPAGTFILFFPANAHRPNITPGGNKVVKKVVIKVLVAQ